jgi:hypothetical protein
MATGTKSGSGYAVSGGPQGPQGPQGTPGVPAFTSAYGSWYDTADQTALVAATAYPMRYNTLDFASGVSVTNDGSGNPTQIVVTNAGIYNIQFSAQLHNKSGGGSGKTVDIWFRKNGIDIPDSTTKVDVGTNEPYVVASWNYLVSAAALDVYQIMWATANTSIIIEHELAAAPHPAVPSLILTVWRVA